MITSIRRNIQGNIIGWVALFVALTGTSYAAVKLAKGSVKSVHIAKGAVNSSKVKDASLAAKDFNPNELKSIASAGPQGETGPQGSIGETGAQGPQGDPGVSDATVKLFSSEYNSDSTRVVTAACHTGKRPLAGPAFYIFSLNGIKAQGNVVVTGVAPIYTDETKKIQSGWKVSAGETIDMDDSWQINVYLTCTKIA